jgi:hypothetical protein
MIVLLLKLTVNYVIQTPTTSILTVDNFLLTFSSSFTRSFKFFLAALLFLKLSRSLRRSSFSTEGIVSPLVAVVCVDDSGTAIVVENEDGGFDSDALSPSTGLSLSEMSLGNVAFKN